MADGVAGWRTGPRADAERPTLIGVSLRPQYTDWDSIRDAAIAVDELGFDWLLTSDHLVASHEPDPGGPIFEAWQLVAAWAAITKQVRIGVMVSGVMLRHPALLAKMAITLDHISLGRALCGIGAGWFASEAEMHGVAWPPVGERLERLEEAAIICRSLFGEPRTTHHGQHYHLTDAVAAPKPIQPHLPLLIGGGGERRTMRIAARHADIWNTFGSPASMKRKIAILHRYCSETGREASSVTPTVALMLDADESADGIRTRLDAYRQAGVGGVVIDLPAPYDLRLLERVAKVRESAPARSRPPYRRRSQAAPSGSMGACRMSR
jgi:alkanesulfonate monooxygenase SsuD/methylene tetrahydromethanopterin reductase-like flavin-dependent oxidoreductase (luciferase family)